MNLIRKEEAPIFTMFPGLTVTGLASPKRGSTETCVWRIVLAPSTERGTLHSVTREEIFVAMSGQATITIAGVDHALRPGDAVIVPADTVFALSNASAEPFEAFVTVPVGSKAVTSDASFTPPWAE